MKAEDELIVKIDDPIKLLKEIEAFFTFTNPPSEKDVRLIRASINYCVDKIESQPKPDINPIASELYSDKDESNELTREALDKGWRELDGCGLDKPLNVDEIIKALSGEEIKDIQTVTSTEYPMDWTEECKLFPSQQPIQGESAEEMIEDEYKEAKHFLFTRNPFDLKVPDGCTLESMAFGYKFLLKAMEEYAQSSPDKAIIAKMEEYIKLLGKELDETATMAHIYGWRSSRVEEGEKLRAELAALRTKNQ